MSRIGPSIPLLILASAALAGCGDQHTVLRDAVRALETQTRACYTSVIERHLRYDASPDCIAVAPYMRRYTQAGGGRPDEPVDIKLMGANVRLNLWQARAASAGAPPTLLTVPQSARPHKTRRH